MVVNVEKTKEIVFHMLSERSLPPAVTDIEHMVSVKLLGVTYRLTNC